MNLKFANTGIAIWSGAIILVLLIMVALFFGFIKTGGREITAGFPGAGSLRAAHGRNQQQNLTPIDFSASGGWKRPWLTLNSYDSNVDIGGQGEFLVDPTCSWGINDVTREPLVNSFRPGGWPEATAAYAYCGWMRFTLTNRSHPVGLFNLRFNYPQMEHIEFYQDSDQKPGYRRQRMGDDIYPYSSELSNLSRSSFYFQVPKGQERIQYVRLFTLSLGQLNATISPMDINYNQMAREALFIGFFYGLIFVFIVLVLWSLRTAESRINISIFAFYIICLAFLSLIYSGMAFQHLWPNAPVFNRYALLLFAWLTISTFLAYLYKSCPGNNYCRRKVLRPIIFCFVLFSAALGWAFHSNQVYPVVNLVLIGGNLLSCLILALTERRGFKPALVGYARRLLIATWLGYCTWRQFSGSSSVGLDPYWAYNGVLVIEFLFRIWLTEQLVERLRTQNRELAESRAALESLSNTDGLTDLYNRRFFEESLVVTGKLEQPVCLIMIDVDHFKKFNDTYGHPAGDQVLIKLARTIKSKIRLGYDLPCRYGGEEFAVLLIARLDRALEVAERIREVFVQEPQQIGTCGEQCLVTLSLGVVERGPNEPSLSFLKRADHALYCSKAGGRNKATATIWRGPDPLEKHAPESKLYLEGQRS